MTKTLWTHFWDMHSGGGTKEKWQHIFIHAPETEAKIIFYNRFGHNPDRVSCTCCGPDYSISEGALKELTKYHRSGRYGKFKGTAQEFGEQPEVLYIRTRDIKPDERVGEVPEQGYVWQ